MQKKLEDFYSTNRKIKLFSIDFEDENEVSNVRALEVTAVNNK